jgi:hypothetical protein
LYRESNFWLIKQHNRRNNNQLNASNQQGMLNDIMLNVVMLSVVAPIRKIEKSNLPKKKFSRYVNLLVFNMSASCVVMSSSILEIGLVH